VSSRAPRERRCEHDGAGSACPDAVHGAEFTDKRADQLVLGGSRVPIPDEVCLVDTMLVRPPVAARVKWR